MLNAAKAAWELSDGTFQEGKKFLQFRIYGYYEWGDDEPTMPELIRFACYDRKKVTFEYLPLAISFDGETHGSPSEPLEL